MGATLLAAGSRLRSSSVALVTGGFFLVLIVSGWITVGHAQPHGTAATATLPSTLRTSETVKITAAPDGRLAFAPDSVTVRTGLVRFDIYAAAAGHTFGFH